MPFEFAYLNFIQQNLRSDFMDTFMVFITYFGEYGVFWIFVSVCLFFHKPTRKYGIILGLALIIDIVCLNGIVKPLVQRARPCHINPIQLLVKMPNSYSFPSGHSGACFTAAFALLFANHKHWRYAMLLAILVGFSRNYLYVHFPTDVLGGMVIGFFAAYVANHVYEKNMIPQSIMDLLR